MNNVNAMLPTIVGAVLLLAQPAVADEAPLRAVSASAHGGYFATYGGNSATRRIEFTANRDGLNNQSGQGSFFNTTTGGKVHFTIDCLSVVGNVATMSGIWGDGQGNRPYFWLQVIDNGEGRNANDTVSPLFTHGDPNLTCNGNPFPGVTYGIDASSGNIQVR